MSRGARVPPPAGLLAPNELVREIGARPNPVYLVRQPATGGKTQLAIAERFEGVCAAGNARGEDFVHAARRIATLASPNVARVRDVAVRGDDLVVFGEYVEGQRLGELWPPDKLPLEIALRAIVDVLTGLGALHSLRDAKQQPLKLAHGEVSPATVVLGLDGIARVLHAVTRCAPGAEPDGASLAYLAPEVAAGDPYDARADVFGAGVLLWEALAGQRLFTDRDPAANAKRVRSGALPRANVPAKAPWAAGLVDVAAKALASSPDERWPTAAVMAAELRKSAGLKLAPASTAAAFARSAFGERVRKRHEDVDAIPAGQRSPQPPPVAPPAPRRIAAASPPPLPVEAPAPAAPETVLVAPGVHAPVTDVVELGSDVLVDAVSSISSLPTPSSSSGGFVLDPFARPGMLEEPPAPPVTVAPVVAVGPAPEPEPPPSPPSVTGAPHFAAAIDLPPPLPAAPAVAFMDPPAPAERLPTSPSLTRQAEEAQRAVRSARRRKLLVLGGVAGLGAAIFALAAVRVAHRVESPKSATVQPSTAAPPPAPPPISTTAAAIGGSPPSADSVTPPTPTEAPARPAARTPPPAVKQALAAAPRVVPASPPPARVRPRPKPTFDPNSL